MIKNSEGMLKMDGRRKKISRDDKDGRRDDEDGRRVIISESLGERSENRK